MHNRCEGELEIDVLAARGGDADSWARLVDRFAGLIWTVARNEGLSAADAAEVSQTTWLRLAEHIDDLHDPERIGAWLVTTARREALRLGRVGAQYVLTDPWQYLDMSSADETDLALLSAERDVEIQHAMALLPGRCRGLLAALVVEEPPLSYAEVSAAMGMPVGSIGPTRGRCLEQLRMLIGMVEDEYAPRARNAEGTARLMESDEIEEAQLLGEVIGALRRLETVPADVVAQAKAAFAWHEVANAVAELDYDSAVHDDDLVGVRGPNFGSDRVLTFGADAGRVELYISDSGRRLLGKVEPNVFRSAVLRHPSRSLTLDVDPSGTFFVDRLPRGPLSVKCVPLADSAPSLETEWVAI